MRLPSLRKVLTSARSTFARFPFSITAAVVGSSAAFSVVEWELKPGDPWFVLNNVFIAATLGVALGAAAVFAAERAGWSRVRTMALQVLLALLVAGYGASLPRDIYSPPFVFGIRHWLLLLAVHLLVAFAAFTRRGETQAFWQFNKNLFLRLLLAALYTGVLQLGLSVALAAVDNLFELKVRPERYLQIWIFLLGVFNTWFFLSGVPERIDELETDMSYPRGLKLFTQYVLLPLVVVYLVILYAYIVKIVVAWDWPKGWVANLILGFSITGVFSLLLVHPLVHRGEERWILRFSRWFYLAEIPLVVVLLLAIGRRVQEYGMTENRYFVVLMGLWLAVMTVYFLIRRNASIKAIPATLCALAVLSSVGPWSAFGVSERSQMGRLAGRLISSGILVHGKIIPARGDVSHEDAREISSGVGYLLEIHGTSPLQPWFTQNLDSLAASLRSAAPRDQRRLTRTILASMGVPYVTETPSGGSWRSFVAKRPAVVRPEGTELVLRGISLTQTGQGMSAPLDSGLVRIRLIGGTTLTVAFRQDSVLLDSLTIGLARHLETIGSDTSVLRQDSLPASFLTLWTQDHGRKIMVVPSRIDAVSDREGWKIRRLDADLFLGPRKGVLR